MKMKEDAAAPSGMDPVSGAIVWARRGHVGSERSWPTCQCGFVRLLRLLFDAASVAYFGLNHGCIYQQYQN
jgi:hypothetical protein